MSERVFKDQHGVLVTSDAPTVPKDLQLPFRTEFLASESTAKAVRNRVSFEFAWIKRQMTLLLSSSASKYLTDRIRTSMVQHVLNHKDMQHDTISSVQ